MSTNFFSGAFFGGDFFGQQVVVVVDTHDGGRDERIRRYRRDREHLREAIRFAIEGPQAAREVIAPFVAADMPLAVESKIDFGALLVAAGALRELADWHEKLLADDQDDEEILICI